MGNTWRLFCLACRFACTLPLGSRSTCILARALLFTTDIFIVISILFTFISLMFVSILFMLISFTFIMFTGFTFIVSGFTFSGFTFIGFTFIGFTFISFMFISMLISILISMTISKYRCKNLGYNGPMNTAACPCGHHGWGRGRNIWGVIRGH